MHRYITFISVDGAERSYSLPDLLWQHLETDALMQLGFTTEIVSLRGQDLGPLFQRVANRTALEIIAVPQCHATGGPAVFEIDVRPL